MKAIYAAHATAIGGRNGHVETDDRNLSLELAIPGGESKKPGKMTNPEQLFACGYAACFGSALEAVAKKRNLDARKAQVTANISLIIEDDGGFRIAAELDVAIAGLDHNTVQKLTEEAHQLCPYSKAIRGNVEVELKAAA